MPFPIRDAPNKTISYSRRPEQNHFLFEPPRTKPFPIGDTPNKTISYSRRVRATAAACHRAMGRPNGAASHR
eukprot:3366457-Prymnesium_polylepis.1